MFIRQVKAALWATEFEKFINNEKTICYYEIRYSKSKVLYHYSTHISLYQWFFFLHFVHLSIDLNDSHVYINIFSTLYFIYLYSTKILGTILHIELYSSNWFYMLQSYVLYIPIQKDLHISRMLYNMAYMLSQLNHHNIL